MDNDKRSLATAEGSEVGVDRHQLSLPVASAELGEFISRLLGQSQTIRRVLQGSFSIDQGWLENIHHLLEQRITQQHSSELVDFSAEVFYKGGLSRKLNSVEAFKTYSEPRSIVSVGARLKWTHLIQFPKKNTPEKQELTLFVSDGSEKTIRHSLFLPRHQDSGYIEYEINHTERTWGDDIEALLGNHISQFVKEKSSFRSSLEGMMPLYIMACLWFGPLIPVIMNSHIKSVHTAGIVAEVRSYTEGKTGDEMIMAKLDSLFYLTTAGLTVSGQFGVHFVATLAIILVLIIAAGIFVAHPPQSFVVLTDETRNRRSRVLQKLRNRTRLSVVSFIIAILASVLGNFLYYTIAIKGD